MQSISTSELPGIPPAAAIVVRTPGSGPNLPRNTAFIAVVVLQVVEVDVDLQHLLHRRPARFELRLHLLEDLLGVQP